MSETNYGGKVGGQTVYVKQFFNGTETDASWIYSNNNNISAMSIMPEKSDYPVFIKNDLYVTGNIYGTLVTPSDIKLKENINDLLDEKCDNILKVIPKSYNYINDENKKPHFGLIAQELEEFFPELVNNTSVNEEDNIKSVNYLELIPLMLVKMKKMQNEIDYLIQLNHVNQK